MPDYLDPQTAEQLLKIEQVNKVVVPIAAIVIGILAIVFLILMHLRESDKRDETIADLQNRNDKLIAENNRLHTLRCIDAYEKCDIESDAEWRISEAERNAQLQIEAAQQKAIEAAGRTQQANTRADKFAGLAESLRQGAVA